MEANYVSGVIGVVVYVGCVGLVRSVAISGTISWPRTIRSAPVLVADLTKVACGMVVGWLVQPIFQAEPNTENASRSFALFLCHEVVSACIAICLLLTFSVAIRSVTHDNSDVISALRFPGRYAPEIPQTPLQDDAAFSYAPRAPIYSWVALQIVCWACCVLSGRALAIGLIVVLIQGIDAVALRLNTEPPMFVSWELSKALIVVFVVACMDFANKHPSGDRLPRARERAWEMSNLNRLRLFDEWETHSDSSDSEVSNQVAS
eukprot:c4412_g1_i1.p1 GENE.c4412_g1_i1~~c4412_g1_i1.p1  ORF type:complete len:262 (+),score=29.13 c4412_g1_i1:29-814(+)